MIININKLKLFTYSIFFILFLSSCSEPIEKINAGKDCKKCNLSNADLSGLTLNGIDLTGADLSGANLSNTKILGVNFTDAILKDTDLSNSQIDMYDDGSKVVIGLNPEHQTRFVNSDLSDANLENATARFTIFLNSNLTNANLRNLETSFTKFTNVNFTNSILENFDVDDAEVINPIIPISNKPMGSIAEANTLLANSKKLDAAKKMFFSDYYGTIATDNLTHSYDPLFVNILDSFSVASMVRRNGYRFYGTDRDIQNEVIDPYYYTPEGGSFYPKEIKWFICKGGIDTSPAEVKPKKDLPNIDQYDLQDEDKKLYKMILDEAAYNDCRFIWGEVGTQKRGSPKTTLDQYLYDYYIDLIDASKISECGYVESSIKLLPAPRRDKANSPKAALTIAGNLQTASRYNKEVTAYNDCVSEAYKFFLSGIHSITDSAIRVTLALNEPMYKEKISKNLAAKKREEETDQYKSKIWELTGKLYTFKDLVYPSYEEIALQVAIERRGTLRTLVTGLDAEEIEGIKESRKNIFRSSMNRCLNYRWLRERNTKKRESIIKKLTNAIENKDFDDDLSKLIRGCAYDANIAYISR